MRAFGRSGTRSPASATASTDEKQRRFRYGVQVNSLGLTEAQPENNVQRIVLEMLGVTLSKDARARAVQLPAWNEALGLPRPWDQQWSLRMQQVLALRDRPARVRGHLRRLARHRGQGRPDRSWPPATRWHRIQEMGGAVAAVESGYLKSALVASHAERRRRVESGDEVIVGVNQFTTTEPSPLTEDLDAAIMRVDPAVEERAILALDEWRAERDALARRGGARAARGARPQTDAEPDGGHRSSAPAPGVTTGEWAGALREVFGEFRAPTGVAGRRWAPGRRAGAGRRPRGGRRAPARSSARPAAPPGRQARPGRALQRRRADRRTRPATPASRSSTRASG